MNNIVINLNIPLINKAIEAFAPQASEEKLEQLKKKQQSLQYYILGLIGAKQNQNEWNKYYQDKYSFYREERDGPKGRFSLPSWVKACLDIEIGTLHGMHTLLRSMASQKVVTDQEVSDAFDQYIDTLEGVRHALIKLKYLENLVEPQL